MNGRKAKALRAMAQAMTVGKPNVKHGRKMIGGSPTATIMLDDCTRRQYQYLKRVFRKAKGNIVVGPKEPTQRNKKTVQE